MDIKLRRMLCCAVSATLLLAGGCATTKRSGGAHARNESGAPSAESSEAPQASSPSETRNVTELMRAANEAFRKANEAQESGDQEAALRHYTEMLQLLIKADLDPGVFYNLRGEFERILNNTDAKNPLFAKGEFPNRPAGGKSLTGDLTIPGPLPERVIQQVEAIQTVYPRSFKLGLSRSYKYMPYIREEFAKAGLPEDLAWLAQVESQFTPKIDSRAGAGGMWQFMRGTASRYDVRMDSYVDERYNWQKETHAAIAYLTELYQQFGDWPLAIAAYNMGENGMERAIAAAGGERDLWKLIDTPPTCDMIPDETKNYYAKLLATIIVARNPERYGLSIEPQNPDDFVRVRVDGMYRLDEIEKACGLADGTLDALNPDLVRGVTPPEGHEVATPVSAQEQLKVALNDIKPATGLRSLFASREKKSEDATSRQKTARAQSHVVRRGETLSSISDRYNVTAEALAKANRMRVGSRILSGQRLTIPSPMWDDSDKAEEVTVARSDDTMTEDSVAAQESNRRAKDALKSEAATEEKSAAPKTYTVKAGDTVEKVSQRTGVSVKDLVAANSLSKDHVIRVGQTLKLGAAESSEPAASVQTYTVKAGDTVEKIAKATGASVDDLVAANNLSKNHLILVGQKLTLKGAASSAATKGAAKDAAKEATQEEPAPTKIASAKTYTVKKGDTVEKIAQATGVSIQDLVAANNLSKDHIIRVGQTLNMAPAPVTSAAGKKTEKASSAAALQHQIKTGETLSEIAQQYGVQVGQLLEWNHLKQGTLIRVGQTLVVKPGEADSPSASAASAKR